MGRKRKEPKDWEIKKARKIADSLKKVYLGGMSRERQEGLVRTFYPDIYGRPIKTLSDKQLYRVAERLYHQTFDWAERMTSDEKEIYGDIGRLSEMVRAGANRDEVETLDERICIKIEYLPDDNPVVRAYGSAKIL